MTREMALEVLRNWQEQVMALGSDVGHQCVLRTCFQ